MACARRRTLLDKLQCMVDRMPNSICCGPKAAAGLSCPTAPVIELYDPCPKPAIPLGGPAPTTPLDPTIPVPHVAAPSNPCGGCCIPIITPQPVPCIPLARACPVPEQPCVPCSPPQMMVAYRRGPCCPVGSGGGCCGGGGCCYPLGRCRSRELRASQLMRGCVCVKKNGLQDDCPRSDCQGSPCCTTPNPMCCPSKYADGASMARPGGGCSPCGGGGCPDMVAEYQCYPAYFKMPPNCAAPCLGGCPLPCQPSCGPCPAMCGPCSPGGPCVPTAPGIGMSVTPPECPCCPGPCLPTCCPPVPTIALPPCPPITVPAPPPVIPTPVPIPVPTPVYPSCLPPCPPSPPCIAPCCPC